MDDAYRGQSQHRVPQVEVLAHAVVKAESFYQRTENRVVHGRHKETEQVCRKDIGKAASLDKDIALRKHVGHHHGQDGGQADQKTATHKNEVAPPPPGLANS